MLSKLKHRRHFPVRNQVARVRQARKALAYAESIGGLGQTYQTWQVRHEEWALRFKFANRNLPKGGTPVFPD